MLGCDVFNQSGHPLLCLLCLKQCAETSSGFQQLNGVRNILQSVEVLEDIVIEVTKADEPYSFRMPLRVGIE